MAYGEHAHDYQYGEPKEVMFNGQLKWFVTRFCSQCFMVEEIELITKN